MMRSAPASTGPAAAPRKRTGRRRCRPWQVRAAVARRWRNGGGPVGRPVPRRSRRRTGRGMWPAGGRPGGPATRPLPAGRSARCRRSRGAAARLEAFSAPDGPAAPALAVLVVVSCFPALRGGFVWDDVVFAEEPVIHSPRRCAASGSLPRHQRAIAIEMNVKPRVLQTAIDRDPGLRSGHGEDGGAIRSGHSFASRATRWLTFHMAVARS